MSDLMIFFPAVLYFATVYYSGNLDDKKSSKAWHILMILLNPCLILIDHGHFQVYPEMQEQCCYPTCNVLMRPLIPFVCCVCCFPFAVQLY